MEVESIEYKKEATELNVVVDKKATKKEEPIHPRALAKMEELRRRGLLTSAKAYICPNDTVK